MSEPVSSLRTWIARHKPDKVRCTLASGEQREIPRPTTARGQWAQLEHAITIIRPAYLEAIRGTEVVASRALDVEEEEQAVAAPASAPADPMTVMVTNLPTIVQLIVDAADASARRHAEAYEVSFREQLALVKIMSDRLAGLERAWQRMLMTMPQAADDGADGMAMMMMQRMMGGEANANANGKADPKKPA